MINLTQTSPSQNAKVDTHLPLEPSQSPADPLTDDGVSENTLTLTFKTECKPIYPFRFWCQPDVPKLDTHYDEPLAIDEQTPELDTTPDTF